MSKTTSQFFSLCLAATLVWGLTACGGGGGGGGSSNGMGQMTLSVADAPVDGAQHVVVEFTGVELVPNSGDPVNITFDMPKSIDLITQSGTASAQLFSQPIAAGTYGQIRLTVMADGDPSHSYMVLSDGTMHGLLIPSGAETGLKLVNDFTVGSSGVTDYSIDFDLRKAVTCPPGHAPACILKPVERLVDNTTVGNIQGTIAMALIPMGCTPAVYLYSGSVTMPEDYNSMASAGDMNQPIASKVPALDQSGDYYYQFTFLSPGSYSLAYTCQASMDNPDQVDAAVLFTSTPVKSGIGVAAGQTVSVNFP